MFTLDLIYGFYSLITGDHTQKKTGITSDGEFWTSKVIATLAVLDKEAQHVKPLMDIDEEVQASLSKTEKAISQLRKVESCHASLSLGSLTGRARRTTIGSKSHEGSS